ncbi:hypothetical protein ACX12M_12690 [Cellulosimicrobium cellulans]
MTTTPPAATAPPTNVPASTPAGIPDQTPPRGRRSMRAGSTMSEAWRNVLTGTTRAAPYAVVLLLAVGVLAAVDARAVVDVVRGAQDFRDAGASVQVLESPEHVDAARCEALTQITGVRAAGALRAGEPVRALKLPGSELSTYEITPGLARVLDPSATTASGVWLASDLAEALGIRAGDQIATSTGTAVVAGVYPYPDDGRVRTLGYTLLAPVPATGSFDACWAEIWPADATTAAYLRTALVPDPSGETRPTQSQLNARLGTSYDAPALLAERLTRHAPVAALAVGIALGYTAIRSRRLELAAALHARVPRPALAWQALPETLAWTLAATTVAATALWWVAAWENPDLGIETWATGARSLAAGAVGTFLGAQTAVLTTREKHLFRYFKER